MLPQLSGIPLPTTDTSSGSSRSLNQTLPVGQNVSATVVAVSRDQVQPEIFRLKLEINNRLIQMGVFQALPIGQKINVNRQSDGQIQITPQNTPNKPTPEAPLIPQKPQAQPNTRGKPNLSLSIQVTDNTLKLPTGSKTTAAVISSRPIYPQNTQAATPATNQSSASPITPSILITPNTANKAPIQQQTQQQTVIRENLPPAMNKEGIQLARNTPLPQTPSTQTPLIPTTQSKQATPAAPIEPTTTKNQISLQHPPSSSGASPVEAKIATPSLQGQQEAITNKPAQPLTSTAPQENKQTTTNNPTHNTGTPAGSVTSRPLSPPVHHAITLALNNGSKVEVTSPQPLAQGTQLQITKTSNQEFQVLQLREPISPPSSALERPAVQETLRHALPNQIPTADAFTQLSQVAAKAEGPQASQISSVVRSMLQLFGVRPGTQEAPSQIKQNLELGGLSTEHNLSKGTPPHPQEMKSQLQQLQKLANSLPPEQKERLEQLLQGIQSRVTSQQLHSLQQWKELPDGGFERVLQLDLPIKNGEHWDNLELRLSREGGSNAAGEMISVWRVRLHFDLEEQGGVDAEIRLSDGHEISTLFWCELQETAEKLKQRSDEFSERLRQCGFDNTEVNWHQGAAPEQKQTIHKQLVDLHT